MIDKNKMPLAIGIAFVAFTTQFGGGFASGAQLYQYFINYGIWALFMPIIAQALLALFFWYGLRFAFRNKTYNYRSFSDSFYGKYRHIFSNLYEVVYIMLICLAPAVAFATGGSTLNILTGLPYFVCTFLIGVFIFVIAMYGTDIVRKAASTLSVMIIIGLLVVLVPNIIAQWDTIVNTIARLGEGILPVGSKESGSFLSALWTSVVYALFQLASVGLMYQHVKPLTDEKQLNLSMIYTFIVNTVCMVISVFGLLAVAHNEELAKTAVPMLLLVQKGVGAAVLMPIISILIILGAVSTGVNMIAGLVTRVVDALEHRDNDQKASASKHMKRSIAVSLVFTVMTFCISQFGLLPLVKVGYSYLGYATLIAVAIPFIVHAVFSGNKPAQKN
ncbi:hypothetical protein OXPF_30130 [Oxobacter pfennigii]|uniref:Uncharacterized protein n=1 Tax=Oxobacter pfennigii TaxID=36849 RepID=A0A0P8Y9M6_9CLOT|nr:hypothetical protein [Oxobacter pfennigii]KPU43572.1 hypothetical protein OXPF_30130 [Oxobacter pfennigii]